MSSRPFKSTRKSWEIPNRPWVRLHRSCWSVWRKIFAVTSWCIFKWIDVKIISSTSTDNMIQAFRDIFATHGLPELLLMTMGPLLQVTKFTTFLQQMASNTLRHHHFIHVQMDWLNSQFKPLNLLWKNYIDHGATKSQMTTGITPAELLMKRKPWVPLDLLHPDFSSCDYLSPSCPPSRIFQLGDTLFAKQYLGT